MRWWRAVSAALVIALPGSLVTAPGPQPIANAQVFPDLSTPFAQRILWANALLEAGLLGDSLAVYEQEIERLRAEGDRDREHEFISGLAAGLQYQGHFDAARRYYERAQALFAHEAAAPPYVVHSLAQALGTLYQRQGQWEQALETYQAALTATAHLDADWASANTFKDLGLVYHNLGQWPAAHAAYQQALAAYAATDDYEEPEAALVLSYLGLLYQAEGDSEAARQAYEQARQQAAKLEEGTPRLMFQTLALQQLQQLAEAQGQTVQAQTYAQAAAALLQPAPPGLSDEAHPGSLGLALGWVSVGEFYLAIRDSERAQQAFDQAVATAQQSFNQPYDPLLVLRSITHVYTQVQQPAQAIPYQQQALAVLAAVEMPPQTDLILQGLAALYLKAGQFPAALATYQQALAAYDQQGQTFGYTNDATEVARIWQGLAQAYQGQGNWEQALLAYQRALELSQAAQSLVQQLAVLEQWAAAATAGDRPQLAQDLRQQAQALRQQEAFGPWRF